MRRGISRTLQPRYYRRDPTAAGPVAVMVGGVDPSSVSAAKKAKQMAQCEGPEGMSKEECQHVFTFNDRHLREIEQPHNDALIIEAFQRL